MAIELTNIDKLFQFISDTAAPPFGSPVTDITPTPTDSYGFDLNGSSPSGIAAPANPRWNGGSFNIMPSAPPKVFVSDELAKQLETRIASIANETDPVKKKLGLMHLEADKAALSAQKKQDVLESNMISAGGYDLAHKLEQQKLVDKADPKKVYGPEGSVETQKLSQLGQQATNTARSQAELSLNTDKDYQVLLAKTDIFSKYTEGDLNRVLNEEQRRTIQADYEYEALPETVKSNMNILFDGFRNPISGEPISAIDRMNKIRAAGNDVLHGKKFTIAVQAEPESLMPLAISGNEIAAGLLSKRMVEATKASGIPKSEADVMTDIREANSVLENDARFKEVFNKLYPVLEDNSPIRDEFVRMQGLRQVSANAKDKADVIAYRAKVLTDFFSKVTTDELQNDVTKGGAFSIAIDPKYKSTYEALAREKAKVGIIDVYKALTDKKIGRAHV